MLMKEVNAWNVNRKWLSHAVFKTNLLLLFWLDGNRLVQHKEELRCCFAFSIR